MFCSPYFMKSVLILLLSVRCYTVTWFINKYALKMNEKEFRAYLFQTIIKNVIFKDTSLTTIFNYSKSTHCVCKRKKKWSIAVIDESSYSSIQQFSRKTFANKNAIRSFTISFCCSSGEWGFFFLAFPEMNESIM